MTRHQEWNWGARIAGDTFNRTFDSLFRARQFGNAANASVRSHNKRVRNNGGTTIRVETRTRAVSGGNHQVMVKLVSDSKGRRAV